ncbi:MAG TPA: hypothetical protein VIL03_01165 [Clostridia bacterium]
MKDKAIRIIALLGAIVLTAFAVVFTIALATNFKEPYNILSWLFFALGLCLAAVVWYHKKREQNTQELLNAINPENMEEPEQETEENLSEHNTQETETKDEKT